MSAARFTLSLVLVVALLATGASQSLAQPAASPAAPASLAAPGAMLIVENAGQWPEAARFQVWNSPLGPGTTWLAEDAIWLVVAGGKSQVAGGKLQVTGGKLQVAGPETSAGTLADLQPANLQPATFHALKITFPGSNPDVRIEPFGAVNTTVSYFIGNDPAQWQPDVPVWSGVRYVDLYPGIDLVMGGSDGTWRLEAAPDAEVGPVRVQVEGAQIESLDSAALRLDTAGETLAVALPAASFSYEAAGLSRHGVPQVLTVHPGQQSSLRAHPAHDPGGLLYGTFLGGSSNDGGGAIAVDSTGSVYVTGGTNSDNFPVTPGAFDPIYSGGACGASPCYDAFVAKLNPTGGALLYATFLGGSGDYTADSGYAIAVDGANNAYITGDTSSPDFPTTPSSFDTTFNGNVDAFAVKLNSEGSVLVYSTFLGGSSRDRGYGIAVDGAGSTYVAGETMSSAFPTTSSAFDPSQNGYNDAFVVVLNPAGSGLTYATFLGGSEPDYGWAVAVDEAGSVYVTGSTYSSDFPTTPNALDRSHNGGDDAFVAKLEPANNTLTYSSFLGSSGPDYGRDIAADNTGHVFVSGHTGSADFPTTPGAFDTSYNGGMWDVFVTKLNPAGSGLVYSTFLGSSGYEQGTLALDGAGGAHVTGYTTASDFPITPDAFDTSFNGGHSDAFVAKLDPSGSVLEYATFLGGSDSEGGDIAVDGMNHLYLAGGTGSSDFPVTPGAFDTSYNGGRDAYVVKLAIQPVEPYEPDVVAPIEQPAAGALVSDAVTLRGFAIDLGSAAGTGIDVVHIYLDGPYGTGAIIGGATYGLDRPDVATQYGAHFRPSGWELDWDASGVAPGVHLLYLYAHRTTDGAWSLMDPHLVIVAGGPARWLPIVLRQP